MQKELEIHPGPETPGDGPKVPTHMYPMFHHPALETEGTRGHTALSAAHEALTEAYHLYTQMEETEKLLNDDRVKWQTTQQTGPHQGKRTTVFTLPHGREHEYQGIVDAAYKRTITTISSKMDTVLAVKQALETSIADAIKDPDGESLIAELRRQEIRNHVSKLDEVERITFVEKAIKSGDKRVAGAIIHAPNFLTGFTDEQHAQHKQMAQMVWATQDYEQLQETSKLVDRVNRAAHALTERYSRTKNQGITSATQRLSKALADMGIAS